MPKPTLPWLLTGLLLAWLLTPATAQDLVFPADAGLIDITKSPYNADKTGTTDASDLIQKAIQDYAGNFKGRTIYFPAGTYLVSKTLAFSTVTGDTDNPHLTLQGAGKGRTIIRLADGAAGFGSPTTPKPVISTLEGSSNWSVNHFGVFIKDLSVDAGNNPGAIGIFYLANNYGALRNVRIYSSANVGVTGIDMTLRSVPGPAFISQVEVEGFNYGVDVRNKEYSMVMEDIRLTNQKVAGIRCNQYVLSLRKISSSNNVPALLNTHPDGLVTIVDSELKGGGAGSLTEYAIRNSGHLMARNVTTSQYKAALYHKGAEVPGSVIGEFVSSPIVRTDPLFQQSLNLPVKESPVVAYPPLSEWVSVVAFGANANDDLDDTQAIQAAINSGKSTIYFPNRRGSTLDKYIVSQTIAVKGDVQRLIGFFSRLQVASPLSNSGQPIFRFETANPEVVVAEQFLVGFTGSNYYFIEHASAKTLLIRDVHNRKGFAYRNSGTGDAFLENFSALRIGTLNGAGFIFRNQRVWMRQANPELYDPNIVNDGATLWMLGFKLEGSGTLLENKNGASTEVLGGYSFGPWEAAMPVDKPAFINDNSNLSFSLSEYANGPIKSSPPLSRNVSTTGSGRPLPRTRCPSARPIPDSWFPSTPATKAKAPPRWPTASTHSPPNTRRPCAWT